MLVGALIALQLPFWQANLGEYLSCVRLRPLHTNTLIFAFAGNATRLSDWKSTFHFLGWQGIIVSDPIRAPAPA